MSAYASFLLPSAQDLGPFESFLDFRDPQGRAVTKPYLGPVFSLEHSDYETTKSQRKNTKPASNFAPNDPQAASTTLWLGAALLAAVLL